MEGQLFPALPVHPSTQKDDSREHSIRPAAPPLQHVIRIPHADSALTNGATDAAHLRALRSWLPVCDYLYCLTKRRYLPQLKRRPGHLVATPGTLPWPLMCCRSTGMLKRLLRYAESLAEERYVLSVHLRPA